MEHCEWQFSEVIANFARASQNSTGHKEPTLFALPNLIIVFVNLSVQAAQDIMSQVSKGGTDKAVS